MASDPRKRLRYFNGQFLQEQDFIDEQAYHLDRQRRHNRLLHTPGVAEGLEVRATAEPARAEVTPGTAFDGQGRQIILLSDEPRTINLSSFPNRKVLVVISYREPELESDPATVGDKQNTRLLEQGVIQVLQVDANNQPIPVDGNTFPADRYIRLALLTLGNNGVITPPPDLSVQPKASARIGDAQFSKVTISSQGVTDANQFPTLASGAARRVDLQGNLVVSGSINSATTGNMAVRGRLDVQTTSPGLTGTPGAAFIWNGAGAGSCGLVAKITTTPNIAPNPLNAAIAGVAGVAGVHGVYATAQAGTHALNVDGTARITGGVSATHFVDTFINASGQRLTTGDVVKLKGTAVSRFRGLNNKAPVAEITLADRENDTCVIGIVDGEAIPDADTPDRRVEPNDPTFVEAGGEVYLVTLGAFSHCKVDATESPIAVGDLLTSSNNPGHAKKATTPQIGSIIGKALEPLPSGTGYIAVFVNIQ
jgi:hypothetical protein